MFSFDEYRVWLEASEGMMSKVPILFDWDDLDFLIGSDPNRGNFPPGAWTRALEWRYNRGLIDAVKQRNETGSVKEHEHVTLKVRWRGINGTCMFKHIKTGQNKLIQKLSETVDKKSIKSLHDKNKLDDYESGVYGYDLEKVYEKSGGDPLHFMSGMPVMQSQTASNSISAWIHGMANGVLGEAPPEFQGQRVFEQTIPDWKDYHNLKDQYFPSINKDYIFYFAPDALNKPGHPVEELNHPTPILLPGKYVPRIKEGYKQFEPKKGGLKAGELMRQHWADMTDEEKEHFIRSSYGPKHFLARHKDVTLKNFYVIGGFTPTNVQKGEHPRFMDKEEEMEFLSSKARGKRTWDTALRNEAKLGVQRFIRSPKIQFSIEGIVMQLLEKDIVEAARENIIKNLNDPRYTPFREARGKEVADINKNSANRVTKATDIAKDVWQTNISVIGGTRRQREKWEEEGLDPLEQSKVVTGSGSRRWIDILKGATTGRGHIGHSIQYMKGLMGELDSDAWKQEQEAIQKKDALVQITLRSEAISKIIQELMTKFYIMQATWASKQGYEEENIHLNEDSALASALSELPENLDRLGIPYTHLPDDVLAHFKPYSAHEGRPAEQEPDKGFTILNDLMEKGETEIAGKTIRIADIATDSGYEAFVNYMDGIKDVLGAEEVKKINDAMPTLLNKVNNFRIAQGQEAIPSKKPPVGKTMTPKPVGMPGKVNPEPTANVYHTIARSLLEPTAIRKLQTSLKYRQEFAQHLHSLESSGRLTKAEKNELLRAMKYLGGLEESVELPWMFQRVNYD